ncbi:MAG: energy transducer TonB, partial [Spirochaetales bacterium]|nr:energy transducer TonB [Spirochaetales bacterium]
DKMPVYPMSARRLGQQGTVGVNAYIDGSGKVLNVVAARSSGVKSLDEAAVAAVRCWSFGSLRLPDKMNIVRTEIVFKLE